MIARSDRIHVKHTENVKKKKKRKKKKKSPEKVQILFMWRIGSQPQVGSEELWGKQLQHPVWIQTLVFLLRLNSVLWCCDWKQRPSSFLSDSDHRKLREKKKLKPNIIKDDTNFICMSPLLLLISIFPFFTFPQRGKKSVWKSFWSQLKGPVWSSLQVKKKLLHNHSHEICWHIYNALLSLCF